MTAESSHPSFRDCDQELLDYLTAGDILTPAQLPAPSSWSPEKRLAGAVLAAALVEIRDHHDDPDYRREVVEDLRWVLADEDSWPFSFVRMCQLFDLEPDWVRQIVRRWLAVPARPNRRPSVRPSAGPQPRAAVRHRDRNDAGALPLNRPVITDPPPDAVRRTTHAALA